MGGVGRGWTVVGGVELLGDGWGGEGVDSSGWGGSCWVMGGVGRGWMVVGGVKILWDPEICNVHQGDAVCSMVRSVVHSRV
jgi:hypothetical protein